MCSEDDEETVSVGIEEIPAPVIEGVPGMSVLLEVFVAPVWVGTRSVDAVSLADDPMKDETSIVSVDVEKRAADCEVVEKKEFGVAVDMLTAVEGAAKVG